MEEDREYIAAQKSHPVSYTHLDVYKRQGQWACDDFFKLSLTIHLLEC